MQKTEEWDQFGRRVVYICIFAYGFALLYIFIFRYFEENMGDIEEEDFINKVLVRYIP